MNWIYDGIGGVIAERVQPRSQAFERGWPEYPQKTHDFR
jgi:hypothetical protein